MMSVYSITRRLFPERDDTSRYWSLVNRLGAAPGSPLELDSVLNACAKELGASLEAVRCAVVLQDKDGVRSRAAFCSPDIDAESRDRLALVDVKIARGAGDRPTVTEIGDVSADLKITDLLSHGLKGLARDLNLKSILIAPLNLSAHEVSAIVVYRNRRRRWSRQEKEFVQAVASLLSLTIQQAEAQEKARSVEEREALISKISSAVHSSLDSDAVLNAIVSELGAAFSACRCRLALLPDPLPEYVTVTHQYVSECCRNRPPLPSTIPAAVSPHMQTLLTYESPVATEDIETDPKLAPFREYLSRSGVKSMLAAVIRLGGRPIGFIGLQHCESRHSWTQWEMDVLQSVAEQAAVAIRQAELYKEARESATRAALVNQIVASIRRSLDLKETLQVAVEEVGRALGASRTSFRKIVGEKLVVVAEHLSDPLLSLADVPTMAASYIYDYLNDTRDTLVIDDIHAFVAANPELAPTVRGWHVQPYSLSQIICPILINDSIWGTLSISQTDRKRKWTASEIALVEAVTAQMEVAVSHSKLFEEAKQSARMEALISQIIHGINQSNRLDEIFPLVARELGEHLGADSILISRRDDNSDMWTVDCEYSDGSFSRSNRHYNSRDFAGLQAMSRDGVIVCNDAEGDPRFAPYFEAFLRPAGTSAFLTVQVLFKDEPCLAITAKMRGGPREWTGDEVEVMRAAGGQILIALERAELFEQVSRGKVQWEATFDALTDGIFIFDRRGLLRRANKAAAAFEGAETEALIGRRCCTLLQGIEGDGCRVAQVMESGRPVTFELVPEKMERPVLVTIAPLTNLYGDLTEGEEAPPGGQSEGGGDNAGAVCIVRDLSELRAAEAIAREQRGFLVKLIEHANDAIFALSPEGRFIWFNEQLTNLSGYSREELTGSDYRKFIPHGDKKIAVERFTRALAGEAQTFEMRGLSKAGEARLLLVTYTPIYDVGTVTSVLSIARDITEERLASERAARAEKLRALGQLASGVAHNFNNALAAILGHTQLIKRVCADERILERLDIIERAALDGSETVKRIQGFGLHQEGAVHESIDINQLIKDSANLTCARWRDDAQARGLRYEVETDLRPVPIVRGSASELREVFVNIILNALDAMKQGGKLRVTSESNGKQVTIKFIDNGIGMSREVCERIFEPFFTTKSVTGTGLGLAVSHSIIERHGGRIEAQSEPGKGSTFVITLPAARNSSKRESRHSTEHVGSRRVLVVDNDAGVREALVGMLRSAGHVAEHATGGHAALERMEGELFDLVFTDLSMPEMDGWALAGEIRRRWPETKILLTTGYALPQSILSNNSHLIDGAVFKPVQFDDLTAVLGQVLSGADAADLLTA